MKPLNPWPRLLRINGFLLAIALLGGWLSGHFLAVVAVVAIAMLAWHLRNLIRLERWLRVDRKLDPPLSKGLWGEVFDGLYRLNKRHRQRYRKLRDLLRRYRDSAKAMPDATVVLRKDYRIEWWNDAASSLLGLRWPADEGQRITNLYRNPEFIAFMEDLERDGGRITLPAPVDERLGLEIRLVPYGKKQYLLLARDITHLQRLETMRSDFVANVSHELRTPLTVIYGLAETLEDELRDNEALAGTVQLLQEQSERMKLLVDDLLLLSRLETGQAKAGSEPVDVARLLAQLAEEARLLSGEAGHTIALEADPGCTLRGTESELRSAFANLLVNAVKYTPAGGAIRIDWCCDEVGATFAVTDNGPGIAAHHVDRLTERFYRVDDGRSAKRGGTGLGLAIVKHVLSRHGGELTIDSRPGHGSTFACHFPAARLSRSPAALSSTRHESITEA